MTINTLEQYTYLEISVCPQPPDIMLLHCGGDVCSLLPHDALQGEGATRPRQRQVHPLQGWFSSITSLIISTRN